MKHIAAAALLVLGFVLGFKASSLITADQIMLGAGMVSNQGQLTYNTATIIGAPILHAGACDFVVSSNGTTNYSYNFAQAGCQTLKNYTKGMHVRVVVDVTNAAGLCTLNLDSNGQKDMMDATGVNELTTSYLVPGEEYGFWFDGNVFRLDAH